MSNSLRGLICALFVLAFAPNSKAGIIIQIAESGSDVLMTTTGGSLNVSGLTFYTNNAMAGFIYPTGLLVGGAASGVIYKGTFTSFTFATSGGYVQSSLDLLGPVGFVDAVTVGEDQVFVPTGSVDFSGIATIPTGSSTLPSSTLLSLGLTPGSYTVAWGTGPNQDSITVNVVGSGAAVPEPGTAAIGLLLGGAAMLRRFRKRRA